MRLLFDPAVIEKPAAAPVVDAPAKVVAPAAAPAPVVPAAPAPAPASAAAAVPAAPAAPAWNAPKPAEPVAAVPDPAKPAAPAPAAPVKEPEKFDLKVPDGVKMEPAALEGYKNLSKELGLTSEQTQKLLDRDLQAQKTSRESLTQQIQKQDADWAGEIRTKQGEKYAEFEATVSRAFDYGDPDGSFRKALGEAGLLNNPRLIGFVERFGSLFKEDKIPSGATGAPKGGKDNRPLHERLIDEFKKLNKAK